MAKRGRKMSAGNELPGGQQIGGTESGGSVEGVVVSFAQDLGNLLGQAQNQAETWMGQRAAVVKQLESIRETATNMLAKLGHTATEQVERIRRRGRPKKFTPPDSNPAGALKPEKKTRTRGITPAGRAAISVAQKARWAALKNKRGQK